MGELLWQNSKASLNLLERLSRSPLVSGRGPEEAETLTHAFSDLEESFRRLLYDFFPKLANPSVKGEALDDLLIEVREEFRHVLYHIHDPKFFRVVEPTHTWLQLSGEDAANDPSGS